MAPNVRSEFFALFRFLAACSDCNVVGQVPPNLWCYRYLDAPLLRRYARRTLRSERTVPTLGVAGAIRLNPQEPVALWPLS